MNINIIKARLRFFLNRRGNSVVEQIDKFSASVNAWAKRLDEQQDAAAQAFEAEKARLQEAKTQADQVYEARVTALGQRHYAEVSRLNGKATALNAEQVEICGTYKDNAKRAKAIAQNLTALTKFDDV